MESIIHNYWPQVLALLAFIAWLIRLEAAVKTNISRLDRHEARLSTHEQTQQNQAVQLARIEEMVSAMKLTLDRMYSEMRERG